MRETKALPKELYEPLDQGRKALKLSQTEIARRTGLPQATISNCLRGQAIQKESILAILNALTQIVGEKRTLGSGAEEEAARLGQAIQRAYTFCNTSVSSAGFRAHPGGGMPPNAINRLERPDLWREMEEALQDHPFSMAVDGPLQSGKTTLLLQLAEAARKENFAVAFFDCIIVPDDQPSSVLFSGLARTLASEWGLELPVNLPDDTFSFTQWFLAKRRAQPEPRGILILDQVTDLKMELIRDLESVIRGLHNQRGWLNVSFVVGRCPKSSDADDWILKSRGYFHPAVEVRWFDAKEVAKLVELHPDCPQSPGVTARLVEEFCGQPFLTHAAIVRLAKGSVEEVVQEALRLEGHFGWFYEETKRALRHATPALLQRLVLCQEDQALGSAFFNHLLSSLRGRGE
jgi:transcriptional regulator with XRE-family HTH domain